MPEDRDALLLHYRRMREQLLAAIDGLDDAALRERSLDGWSVKDHIAHIALWDEIRTSEVERISAGHASAWRVEGRDDEISPLFHDLRREFSMEQARWEFETSHRRLLDAIARASEKGLDASRYGEAGLLSRHEAMHTHWIARWRAERRT